MGLYFSETDKEPSFIYASDHDVLDRIMKIGDSLIERNSTGVFKGTYKDLENHKNTYPIYETNEPCLFFKNIDGDYIFGGQRGELAFGYDNGKRWETTRLDKAIKKYFGKTYDFLVLNDYILIKKY